MTDREQRRKEIETELSLIAVDDLMEFSEVGPQHFPNDRSERCAALKAELATIDTAKPGKPPMPQSDTARYAEIRSRLQELVTQSIAVSDAEFEAITKESMALWAEMDKLNAGREQTP